jgi:glycine cleavage system protein P-like pyridoxal-binding family
MEVTLQEEVEVENKKEEVDEFDDVLDSILGKDDREEEKEEKEERSSRRRRTPMINQDDEDFDPEQYGPYNRRKPIQETSSLPPQRKDDELERK